jgi:hypothetical protein
LRLPWYPIAGAILEIYQRPVQYGFHTPSGWRRARQENKQRGLECNKPGHATSALAVAPGSSMGEGSASGSAIADPLDRD